MKPTTALEALESFILLKAPKHHATPLAPASWDALRQWGENHILGVDSLPVSSENSERTIYSSPRVNYAFRAWHDALHLHYRLSTSVDDEYAVAALHRGALRGELGIFEAEATRILWADTAGQTSYFQIHGRFPYNQRAFVLAYLSDPAAALAAQF